MCENTFKSQFTSNFRGKKEVRFDHSRVEKGLLKYVRPWSNFIPFSPLVDVEGRLVVEPDGVLGREEALLLQRRGEEAQGCHSSQVQGKYLKSCELHW